MDHDSIFGLPLYGPARLSPSTQPISRMLQDCKLGISTSEIGSGCRQATSSLGELATPLRPFSHQRIYNISHNRFWYGSPYAFRCLHYTQKDVPGALLRANFSHKECSDS